MDSLIVLQKPLRKTLLGAKSAPKMERIPTEPGLTTEPQYAPDISFARLWQQQSPAPAASRPHHNSPALSNTSLLTHYHGHAAQPKAELVLELDYTTSVKHTTAS